MYPEVEQFLAARDAAWAAYQTAEPSSLDLVHDSQTCPVCIRDAAYGAAWDALKGSTDPLVRWIAENCEGYPDEAEMVLRVLPAPMSELDALAREQRWCKTWSDIGARAREAGVLPAEELHPEASER